MHQEEGQAVTYKLTHVDNVFSSCRIEVGNINNGTTLDTYVGVTSGQVNGHVIEIPGKFHLISEACGTWRSRF